MCYYLGYADRWLDEWFRWLDEGFVACGLVSRLCLPVMTDLLACVVRDL